MQVMVEQAIVCKNNHHVRSDNCQIEWVSGSVGKRKEWVEAVRHIHRLGDYKELISFPFNYSLLHNN